MEKSSQVAAGAGQALTVEHFLDFVTKLHPEIDRTRWHVPAISFTVVRHARRDDDLEKGDLVRGSRAWHGRHRGSCFLARRTD